MALIAPIALCIEAPEAIRPALVYAATELLRPLALMPVEVARADLKPGGIYLGPEPEEAPVRSLRFRQRPATVEALLRHSPVQPQEVARLEWNGASAILPYPLGDARPASEASGVVEADVFASAFWWLSGQQEKATASRDRWGRFRYTDSLQAATDTPLATPVDGMRGWLEHSLKACGVHARHCVWDGGNWAVALTHDLDATRTPRLRAFAGGLARGRPGEALRRALGPDARAQSAQTLLGVATERRMLSTLFVKTGDSGPEDVRATPERDATWLREVARQGFAIGLHPSIQAPTDAIRLAAERQRLSRIVGSEPLAVRSHYLRWEGAITPALYCDAGFRVDSTLGWSERPGFRRGTAQPFRLWDAARNCASELMEAPLAVMDTSMFEHQGLSPEAATVALVDVLDAVRKAKGVAVVLWHNEMADLSRWTTRLDTLLHGLRHAESEGARFLTLDRVSEIARGYSP